MKTTLWFPRVGSQLLSRAWDIATAWEDVPRAPQGSSCLLPPPQEWELTIQLVLASSFQHVPTDTLKELIAHNDLTIC